MQYTKIIDRNLESLASAMAVCCIGEQNSPDARNGQALGDAGNVLMELMCLTHSDDEVEALVNAKITEIKALDALAATAAGEAG